MIFRAAVAAATALLLSEAIVHALDQGIPSPANRGPGRGAPGVPRGLKRKYRNPWTSLIGNLIREARADEKGSPGSEWEEGRESQEFMQ
jgi:hypothetical protein